ncbi:MAG: DUF1573 domain-containing protein [Candidatus Poribacteria bacterium]|nr:DUF1573 domain-containing protein [Candidatus Poribacteria bacterium]
MSKRTILTYIIIPTLLIAGLIIFLRNNPQEPTPELLLERQHINFGTLPEWDGPVTRTVTARNVGKNTLRIQNVHTGCSYAKITAPEQIRPNEAAAFHIDINPEILPADQTLATATIFTDSLKTPSVSLTIVAAAKRFATLNPDVCDFGNIRPETTHQKELKLIVNAPLNTSDLRLLPSNHSRLTWEMTPDPDTDTSFLVTVQLAPRKDRGTFSSLLTVAFPNERTLTLPVTAKVMAPVTAHPQTLSYGVAVAGTQPSLEFTLSAESRFEVLKVETPTVLEVSIMSDTGKQHQKRLKVVWHVPDAPEPLREEIQILTTADPLPIRIPVYGFIQLGTAN